ncbi:MAG: polymer-forming cytoskeletal protein [Alphaproteobacteria bacterium]|nr:polymer-forming cytoskeletal protein [Alphaproteobacteria bacterium]
MQKYCLLSALAAAMVLSGTTLALADDTACGGGDVLTGKIDGNVIADNGLCTLDGARVKGNVEVEGDGFLFVQGTTRVDGNIQCDSCDAVQIVGATIKGDLQIKGASVVSGYSADDPVNIQGNVQYEENPALLAAIGGIVGGDVQVFKNTGGALIGGNTIEGNLQCKENDPAPTPFGAPNTVDGNKEDQCAENLGF